MQPQLQQQELQQPMATSMLQATQISPAASNITSGQASTNRIDIQGSSADSPTIRSLLQPRAQQIVSASQPQQILTSANLQQQQQQQQQQQILVAQPQQISQQQQNIILRPLLPTTNNGGKILVQTIDANGQQIFLEATPSAPAAGSGIQNLQNLTTTAPTTFVYQQGGAGSSPAAAASNAQFVSTSFPLSPQQSSIGSVSNPGSPASGGLVKTEFIQTTDMIKSEPIQIQAASSPIHQTAQANSTPLSFSLDQVKKELFV